MKRVSVPYREGDWFAVPLRSGGYGIGSTARRDRDGGKPSWVTSSAHSISSNLMTSDLVGRTADNAILTCICSDLGLLQKEWPIIDHSSTGKRDDWPMPIFGGISPDKKRAWRSEYSEEDLGVELRSAWTTAEDARRLPEDGLWGYGAVEVRLTKLLTSSAPALSNVGE